MDLPFSTIYHKDEPDYKEYMKCTIYMLEVFSATHCRRFPSGVIPKEFKEVIKTANQLDQKIQKIVPKYPKNTPSYAIRNNPLNSDQRKAVRLHILDFLEVPDGALRDEFLEHSNFYRVFDYAELVKKIAGLSQGSIANVYKSINSPENPDMKHIKNTLAKFLFQHERNRK